MNNIKELFEIQASKIPFHTALIHENTRLTYDELNSKANQLAHYLIKKYSIIPDTLITLCLERSEVSIIAILAVIKAGGAYVPIDPQYPQERIDYICQDTQSPVLITNEWYDSIQENLTKESTHNLSVKLENHNLVYVIYTSGTTGNPKGVLIEHGSLINHISALTPKIYNSFEQGKKLASFMAYVFDASIQDYFITLIGGGELHLLSEKLRLDVSMMSDYIIENKINHFHIPPALLTTFPQKNYPTLLTVCYGGEACEPKTLEYWSKKCAVYNCYGPTESTICTTFKKMCNNDNNRSIGTPIDNVRCYVLDSHLSCVEINEVGELYIGGFGLARGYLNKEKLTNNVFISNPFQTKEEKNLGVNSRLYRTGDLVKLLADGSLQYEGRIDFQVKIRGFRIELGEIESAINDYHQNDHKIIQSVVIAKSRAQNSTNNQFLVGYYVSPTKINEAHLFSYLSSKLPEYMVPNFLIRLSSLPLTINGKIDRKVLPEPDLFKFNENYVAPTSELQKQMCQIWAEVLSLDEATLGIHDDFFRLGGDSIVGIQLINALRQKLKISLSVKDIFAYKTIANLSDYLSKQNRSIVNALSLKTEQDILTGNVPLLPIQTWFFEKAYQKFNHWNQSFLIEVPALDIARLNASIQKLFKYHDSFRLKFNKDEHGQITQYYDESIENIAFNTINIQDLKSVNNKEALQEELESLYTNWQNDFNIFTGPLARSAYVHGFEDKSARIYFALHHLIVDAVSWRILARDLKKIYEEGDLGLKSSSYRQWCHTVLNYPNIHQDEASYWNSIVADFNPVPLQNLANANANAKDSIAHTSLDAYDTNQLLTVCNKTYQTQINDLLLTALAYALTSSTNAAVTHVAVEGHGREEIDTSVDMTQQLGWFTIMYPVRLEVKESLSKTLKSIKNQLHQKPNNGIGYGAIHGYHSDTYPLITFNYLGQFSKEHKSLDWHVLSDSSGLQIHPENQLPSLIVIEGAVFSGKLHFKISSRFTNAQTQELAVELNKAFKAIINHTVCESRTYLTASDIDYIIRQDYLDRIQEKTQIDGVYLANSLQQGFIYHALHQGQSDDAYRVQLLMEYHKPLNLEFYQQCWGYAQEKYPALRMRFAWSEQMVQVIDSSVALNWNFVDLSQYSHKEQNKRLNETIQTDRSTPFDIATNQLYRVTLIKLAENFYTCILNIHHIISDGWSGPKIFHFIHETYAKLSRNEKINFSFDQTYIDAQKYLQTQKTDLLYWKSLTSEIEKRNDLSGLLKPSKKNTRIEDYKQILEPKEKIIRIDSKFYLSLKEFGKDHGVTTNAILQYVWHKLLSLYGNSAQTVVGTTLSGRDLPFSEIEDSVGLYINTLPLIFDHTQTTNIVECIKTIQERIQDLNSRSADNLTYLQQDGVRLFDSMFVYDSYPAINESDYDEILKPHFKGTREKVDYPLGSVIEEDSLGIKVRVHYAAELFAEDILTSFVKTFEIILRQITIDNILDVKNLKFCPSQQSLLPKTFFKKEDSFDNSITELFERQVLKTPHQTALVYEKRRLSYKDLNEKSNQLAHYLKKNYKIQLDTLLTLCLERSEVMIIAILAVLKSGGAYVPIDPKYPQERIDYILEDTQSPLLITDEWYQGVLDALNSESKENPSQQTQAQNLAYVIYTSGTTGKPKGVMIEHGGLINHVTVLSSGIYELFAKGRKIATFMAYVFDASIQDYFISLMNGAELHIIAEELRLDVEKMSDYLLTEQIHYFHLPPALLSAFPRKEYPHLVGFVYGGEACDLKTLNYWAKYCALYNCYGPTESTICTTFKKMDFDDDPKIIGSVIANVQSYILDSNFAPLPFGAIGELYVGGAGLARGYLNHPELTAEKFIANPFQTLEEKRFGLNERLYKTGDLAAYLPNGNLKYEGRIDFQVKLRGLRIELGEIECTLNNYKDEFCRQVKQSVVLIQSQSNAFNSSDEQYLVGYYVSDQKLDEAKLFEYLQIKLPNYMVPTALVHLEKLPLTVNGKIDRRLLPEANLRAYSCQYTAPRNEIEKKLCEIWAEVLAIEKNKISIQDDFFHLGGNSILAVKLMAKINSVYQSHLNLSQLFLYKNIQFQAKKVLETCDQYQKIIHLNNSIVDKKMFMIHPGTGGCEVYVSLAHQLSNQFDCYGVDSYNLYHDKKIDNLNLLAQYYLTFIDEIMGKKNNKEYHLLGLCLGGKIAMEIATILENRGEKNIRVYLVDTILNMRAVKVDETTEEFKKQMIQQGFDEYYIQKIVSMVPTEQKIQEAQISNRLTHTKILLFKTLIPDPELMTLKEEFCQNILPLKYNNADKYVVKKSQISVVRLQDAHHRNVIQKEDMLIKEISEFNVKTTSSRKFLPVNKSNSTEIFQNSL